MKFMFADYCDGCEQIQVVSSIHTISGFNEKREEHIAGVETIITCRNRSLCEQLTKTPIYMRNPLYICDPEKAKSECKQKGCIAKIGDICGCCWLTTNPEWAALDDDGHPVIPTPCRMLWKDVYDKAK